MSVSIKAEEQGAGDYNIHATELLIQKYSWTEDKIFTVKQIC